MIDYNAVDRPVTVNDMAIAFSVDPSRLRRVIARERISPAFVSGRQQFFGPRQVQVIHEVLERRGTASTVG